MPPSAVRIVEVGPRDGLQNVAVTVPTATKLELIHRLHSCGLNTIELTSVVSPRAVPQLQDCREILKHPSVKSLLQNETLRLPVLVPNVKGLDIARNHGAKEVAVFISATEGFSKANTNRSVEDGIAASEAVARAAHKHNVAVRGYISCLFSDPYDGPTSPEAVLRGVNALLQMGCYEVSLGDTLGVGTPLKTKRLLEFLVGHGVPMNKLAGHFHDTYGQALANVWEAYNCGMRVFDSSVAGLGGCPFAPGAKGNVATEDLVYMFQDAGIHTGVDLSALVGTGDWISKCLQKPNGSRAGAAMSAKLSRQSPAQQEQPAARPSVRRLQWLAVQDGAVDGLLLHRSGVNLRITMSRPRNGNALTSTMIDGLISLLSRSAADPTVGRIIITGSGKFFCTGMDLSKDTTSVGKVENSSTRISSTQDPSPASASQKQFTGLRDLFHAIESSPKVTIACINGPTFGGGVGLALACDLRICAPNASMTLSEVKLGLSAATISKYVIRELGIAFAREVLLSARPVSPGELKSRGVVMAVAPAEDGKDDGLDKLLDETLNRLRAASPDGSRMSKELVKLAWAHGGTPAQDDGIERIFMDMMRPEAQGAHGVKEFQARRPVDWDALLEAQAPSAVRSKL